ncbi:MAG: hypothetical protein Tsb009_00450 [Planctomycetaceae bacterium]
MQAFAFRSRSSCGLLLLLLTGCATYHPYGAGYYPGIYNTPPGQYPVQPGYQAPNGTIPPQNGTLGQPSPLKGSDNSKLQAPSSGSDGNKGPTTLFNGGSSLEANRQNSKSFSEEKPVPSYNDPNKIGAPNPNRQPENKANESPGKTGSPFSPFNGNDGAASTTPENSSGIQQAQLNSKPENTIRRVSGESTQSGFTSPKTLPENPNLKSLPENSSSSTTAPPNPYDHDKKNYTWLRGKVDYDEGSKTWQIIYSLDPKDQYGGSFTLIDHPDLKKNGIKNDDVILIEGEIESSNSVGKPRYKIHKLIGPLAPAGSVQSLPKEPAPAFSNQ